MKDIGFKKEITTSDVNYFEKLHDEIICLAVPEQMCAEIKPYFT